VTFGPGHPLAYPVSVTIGALAVCVAWAPFADLDQLAGLATVALGIVGYTSFQLATALGQLPNGLAGTPGTRPMSSADPPHTDDRGHGRSRGSRDEPRPMEVKRVRQQHRLVSRSWLELTEKYRTRWVPVFFDTVLLTMTESTAEVTRHSIRTATIRCYPSGKARSSEPPGRLIDNPSRPDPEAPAFADESTRLRRRVLLDAQSTVAAPFVGLMWVYVAADGFVSFLGATSIAAATAIWLAAIRGSDPS